MVGVFKISVKHICNKAFCRKHFSFEEISSSRANIRAFFIDWLRSLRLRTNLSMNNVLVLYSLCLINVPSVFIFQLDISTNCKILFGCCTNVNNWIVSIILVKVFSYLFCCVLSRPAHNSHSDLELLDSSDRNFFQQLMNSFLFWPI